ncbi:MAG: hypothetical protein AMXMBFR48_19170, partial [Ignavibacteriales bacterium]
PRTKNQEPRTKNQEPRTKNELITNHQPLITTFVLVYRAQCDNFRQNIYPFQNSFSRSYMSKTFDVKSAGISVVVGTAFVVLLTWWSGTDFRSPVFPFMGMLAGFIISGLLVGFVSKEETIAEPGAASLAVGALSYVILSSMELKCFSMLEGDVFTTNILLVIFNGIILTFAGAWAGEKFQGTFEKKSSGDEPSEYLEWGWIVSGSILGITISMIVANIILKFAGLVYTPFFLALVLGLFITGLVIGWKSPGITVKEATLAGFITTVLNLDIFKLSLDPDTNYLTTTTVIVALAAGLVSSYIGGIVGEKIQSAN